MDWRQINGAIVVFHSKDLPNYEGTVSLGPGWVYLHDSDIYRPSSDVDYVQR